MKKYAIDRFEDDFAICEDEEKTQIKLEKSKLYSNAKEGDWFELSGDNAVFLKELTTKNRNLNIELLKELMK